MIVVRHSGRDAGIQSQRCEAYRAYKIKHLCNRQITVHGLDFGIHAEMTDFPAWLDINDESSSLVTSTKRCIVKGHVLGSSPNMSVSPLYLICSKHHALSPSSYSC